MFLRDRGTGQPAHLPISFRHFVHQTYAFLKCRCGYLLCIIVHNRGPTVGQAPNKPCESAIGDHPNGVTSSYRHAVLYLHSKGQVPANTGREPSSLAPSSRRGYRSTQSLLCSYRRCTDASQEEGHRPLLVRLGVTVLPMGLHGLEGGDHNLDGRSFFRLKLAFQQNLLPLLQGARAEPDNGLFKSIPKYLPQTPVSPEQHCRCCSYPP